MGTRTLLLMCRDPLNWDIKESRYPLVCFFLFLQLYWVNVIGTRVPQQANTRVTNRDGVRIGISLTRFKAIDRQKP